MTTSETPKPVAGQPTSDTHWFAIRTRQDFLAEEVLSSYCEEIFFPKEERITPGHRRRQRAVIPHVLFVKTTTDIILRLESLGRRHVEIPISFWVYRYPTDQSIQIIPQRNIDLLRLLTATDATRCEIFKKNHFKENDRVRVLGGPFAGYEGFVQRVRKNRHVVVKIEGVCLVLLPYIHPDLLEKLSD